MNHMRDDRGFTFTELMVVLVLMGIVLSAVYAGLSLNNRAIEIQRRDSFRALALGQPMQMMDIILSQNTVIESGAPGVVPTQYRLSCLTDQNNDGVNERHTFEATTDGRLVETVHRVDSAGTPTALIRTNTWQAPQVNPSSRNVNQLRAKPLFTYLQRDTAGTITAVAAPQANEVLVELWVRYQGVDYSDSRRVMFRNRQVTAAP